MPREAINTLIFVKWGLDPIARGKGEKEGDQTEVLSSDQDILSVSEVLNKLCFVFCFFFNQNLEVYGKISKSYFYNSTVYRERKKYVDMCIWSIHILWLLWTKVLPCFNYISTFSKASFENPETSVLRPLFAFSTILSAWPPVGNEVISTCSAAFQLSANRSG